MEAFWEGKFLHIGNYLTFLENKRGNKRATSENRLGSWRLNFANQRISLFRVGFSCAKKAKKKVSPRKVIYVPTKISLLKSSFI